MHTRQPGKFTNEWCYAHTESVRCCSFPANALATNALVANSVPTATCAVVVRGRAAAPVLCCDSQHAVEPPPAGLDSPLALHGAMSPDGVCVVEGRAGPGSGNPQFASIPDTAQVRFGMRSPAPTSATVVVRVSSGIGYNPSSIGRRARHDGDCEATAQHANGRARRYIQVRYKLVAERVQQPTEAGGQERVHRW